MSRRSPAVVAVLGGSSAFTPSLAAGLAARAADLPPLEVRLFGRDAERLADVARACAIQAALKGAAHAYVGTTDVAVAARGAGAILAQMRIGGFEGRLFDETWPHRFDAPGDETVGLGGLSAAIRSVPETVLLCERARAVAPNAWCVVLSNPLSVMVRSLVPVFADRVFGLCELPLVTRRAEGLPDDAPYAGVNHLGWFYRPEEGARNEVLTPLKYVRLLDAPTDVAREQRARASSRAEELAQLSARLFDAYAKPPYVAPPAAWAARDMPWIDAAVVPTLVALLGGPPCEAYVSTPAAGLNAVVAPEDVVERRATVDRRGPETVDELDAAPLQVRERVALLSLGERFAARAASAPTRRNVAEAVAAARPGVHGDADLRRAVEFLLERHARGALTGRVD